MLQSATGMKNGPIRVWGNSWLVLNAPISHRTETWYNQTRKWGTLKEDKNQNWRELKKRANLWGESVPARGKTPPLLASEEISAASLRRKTKKPHPAGEKTQTCRDWASCCLGGAPKALGLVSQRAVCCSCSPTTHKDFVTLGVSDTTSGWPIVTITTGQCCPALLRTSDQHSICLVDTT